MNSELLNRSVPILEDALSQENNLFKKGLFKSKKLHTSITLTPEELELIHQGHSYNFSNMTTMMDTSYSTMLNQSMTTTGSVLEAHQPWQNAISNLYIEFLEVLQTHTNSQAVLDMVGDLARCCADTLSAIKSLKSKVSIADMSKEEMWLENEQNTWRLIYVLYQDRLTVQSLKSDDDQYIPYFGLSEKLCMLNLFKGEHLVREIQLVIDWLESNASEKDDEVLHFTDNTVGWENTLHQLKSKDTIVFGSTRQIISSLDPDAPSYQKRALHDLDIDDEKRLCRSVFTGIRCGKLQEAQKLCKQCGHSWRAALLEGWKLHHDPNMEDISDEVGETSHLQIDDRRRKTQEMEGNENRDLWKLMALKYCDQIQLNQHEKAAIGVYSGYLKPILPVCRNWNDYLWAHLKVIVDIRVESEIRDCVNRKFHDLPEFYWEQRKSINEIFVDLEASTNKQVSSDARKPEHVIQKYLILDEIPELYKALDGYIGDEDVSTQFLRFATHLVLFFEQIGRGVRRDITEKAIEAYINRLMNIDDVQLVAFYVSKLNTQKQNRIYSSYLERIVDNIDRQEALKYAETCGLNINVITKTVVENIRNKPFDIGDMSLQQKLTRSDEYKISSIEWLLFYEEHRPEALIQSNALLFKFLTLNKMDAAQLLFNKIPTDTIDKITAEGEVSDHIKQSIKEHLSYKIYLDAQETFSIWFKHFKSKPIQPESIPENAHLSEKVAYQHKLSQFTAETKRWELTVTHLARSAKTALYNVLLFPDGGWLNGAADCEYLRSSCIPECAILLATVLFETRALSECIQLADILASEKYGLYQVYSKQKLEDILMKLTECSVALLEEKKDPWGNDSSI